MKHSFDVQHAHFKSMSRKKQLNHNQFSTSEVVIQHLLTVECITTILDKAVGEGKSVQVNREKE